MKQVLFSSTLATYGLDIRERVIDDYSLQRPQLFYGCTKVFAELLGQFYKRKYGLDYRGVRYPSIVGPGVKTPGIVQYTSWVIEESAKGTPFSVWVRPETRPVMYFKDAARAIVLLGEAPLGQIKMVNYVIGGPTPDPSAQELVDMVKAKLPGAKIDFRVDEEKQRIIAAPINPPEPPGHSDLIDNVYGPLVLEPFYYEKDSAENLVPLLREKIPSILD